MPFEKFEGPFVDVELLGCRNVFCGDRLILDLFEYQQSGPDEDTTLGGETVTGVHTIGLTESSRVWRITFDRPYAVRVRDLNLRRREPHKLDLPGRCCFSENTEWTREFKVDDPHLGSFILTHYVFNSLDYLVEILANEAPTVEEIEGDAPGLETEG